MEQLNLKEISEIEEIKDMNFHFTAKDNLEAIKQQGLIPQIGNNSKGIEKNEKVFFSKKPIGVITLISNSLRKVKDILTYKENPSTIKKENIREKYERFYKTGIEYYDINKGKDETIEERAYKILYKKYKDSVYLNLDLKGLSKKDFDNLSENQKASVDYLIDDIDEETNRKMEEHNMHARIGKGIEPEKIRQLTINDRTDALGIIEFLYNILEKNPQMIGKDENDLYSMRNLKKFIEYSNNKDRITMEDAVRNALSKGTTNEEVEKAKEAEKTEKLECKEIKGVSIDEQ